MKIGILHLTDIHIENNDLTNRIEILIKVIEFDLKNIQNLYIVLSGDIVNNGRESEFLKAKTFLDELKLQIKKLKKILQLNVIAVPGNHDCCFDNVKKTRKSIINDCRIDVIEEEDYFLDAMAVQEDYWNFTSMETDFVEKFKISYKLNYTPHVDYKLSFHCYNTSWLTEINEKQGNLIVPENQFIENDNGEYVISVFHHPTNWLSANTNRNNKQRFEEHLIKTSNLVIFGHEHDKGDAKAVVSKNHNVVFCGGKAFNQNKIKETGFSFYGVDLSNKSIQIKTYAYDGTTYTVEFEDNHQIIEKSKRNFIIQNNFQNQITELSVPLKHSKKSNLVLSDVFVYPDLEPLLNEESVVQYPNSSEIIEKIKVDKENKILIQGSDQSGKSALLYTLFYRFYEMGYTPIYLRGKYCKVTDIKKLVQDALKKQYNNYDTDVFFQSEKRILLLDNLHKSELNPKFKKKLLDYFEQHFHHIVITSDSTYNSKSITEEATSLKNYDKFKLLPLGHEKRSELIEQWLRIGENQLTIQDEAIFSEVKNRFDEIDNLIGNRLMPSYPIFILTLLQSLDENLQNFSQTSYANIYLVLIKAGLVKEGIKNSILTSLLNILKELAFYMFENKKNPFNIEDFEDFITTYSTKFFKDKSLTDDRILTILCNSNILKIDDEYYTFSYKYIYYFLIAQKISSEIEKREDLIYELCNNINLEINANILIFLSHHSKAQILIDNIVFSSQLPFENATPITLDKNDEFVKFITEFTNEIKHEIIEDINPRSEVKKELQRKDKIEREKMKNENNEEEKDDYNIISKEATEMNHASRSIRIMGQIVKNQSGDFEKEKLIKLVDASYKTMFRVLGFYSDFLGKDKEMFIETLVKEIKEKQGNRVDFDNKVIEKNVRKLLQFVSWRICVDGMTNLMFAVGAKGQNELYEKVNKQIDSTASKIVTFAIKTFYDKIDLKELKKLFDDVKDNYLAQCILREYIKRYLYTNYVERKKRDQIIQITGFSKPKLIPLLKK